MEYGVGHFAISYIFQQKENFKRHSELLDAQHGNRKKTRMDTVEDSLLKKSVFYWFSQKRSLGEPVSGTWLQENALEINKKLNGANSFTASSGWLTRFKERHGIRELSIQGERLSLDNSGSDEFKEIFNSILQQGGYDLDNVYNADETGLAWKSLPRRTLAGREETQAAGRKNPKD